MNSDTPVMKSGVTLAVIAAICTALVAVTYRLTADRIVANELAILEQSLQPALSGRLYDSGVSESRLVLPYPHGLPGSDDAIVYRVFKESEPVAALLVVTARDGFSGAIRLLIGIDFDGIVTGVRVLEHRETPGLGDKIESRRTDWILQFDGHSLHDPDVAGWAIHSDGGQFDQLTGASVTPRAVIKAIRETLIYFEANRDEIFSMPATEDDQ
jgi:electron transport complex protein RnfG